MVGGGRRAHKTLWRTARRGGQEALRGQERDAALGLFGRASGQAEDEGGRHVPSSMKSTLSTQGSELRQGPESRRRPPTLPTPALGRGWGLGLRHPRGRVSGEGQARGPRAWRRLDGRAGLALPFPLGHQTERLCRTHFKCGCLSKVEKETNYVT